MRRGRVWRRRRRTGRKMTGVKCRLTARGRQQSSADSISDLHHGLLLPVKQPQQQ
jgi:hypothetical protein